MELANHGLILLQQLNAQREFGFLCDCTVAIGDVFFKAHKAVLAAFSNYFRMLFIHQDRYRRNALTVAHKLNNKLRCVLLSDQRIKQIPMPNHVIDLFWCFQILKGFSLCSWALNCVFSVMTQDWCLCSSTWGDKLVGYLCCTNNVLEQGSLTEEYTDPNRFIHMAVFNNLKPVTLTCFPQIVMTLKSYLTKNWLVNFCLMSFVFQWLCAPEGCRHPTRYLQLPPQPDVHRQACTPVDRPCTAGAGGQIPACLSTLAGGQPVCVFTPWAQHQPVHLPLWHPDLWPTGSAVSQAAHSAAAVLAVWHGAAQLRGEVSVHDVCRSFLCRLLTVQASFLTPRWGGLNQRHQALSWGGGNGLDKCRWFLSQCHPPCKAKHHEEERLL